MNLPGLSFDRSWTLFLDRDGVINRRIPGGYVTRFDEFIFLDEVKEALKIFSEIFGRIIVVSNQQGIGKGLMTAGDADMIHRKMLEEVSMAGGRIDRVFYCPFLEEDSHPDRKPSIGMALKAREEFPAISFSRSLMVGDSPTDIEFGKNAGMHTVMIGENEQAFLNQNALPDYLFPDLISLARTLAGTNTSSI
jgi:histidinol-phosphate phosphatase family protein